MAIRLFDGAKYLTTTTPLFNGVRKFYVSCRVRLAPTINPAASGTIVTRQFSDSFSIGVYGGSIKDGLANLIFGVAPVGGSIAAVQATVALGAVTHVVVVYDADDPAAQGAWVNGIFHATTTTRSGSMPSTTRRFQVATPGGGDYAVEDLVVGSGVIPTEAQVEALGKLGDAPAPVLTELTTPAGSNLLRWTLRGPVGDEFGLGEAGADSTGSASVPFSHESGSPATYVEDMPFSSPVVFGEPTIMSSGRAVDIPLLLDLDGSTLPATAVATNPARKPTFRINGGSPITAELVVGAHDHYDAILCLLPEGTTIGPSDAVTWSVASAWVETRSGASPVVVDQPCRNRVGKTSFDNAGPPTMRVGVNMTLPGPSYWSPYTLPANRGLYAHHGSAGGGNDARRWPEGTLKTPSNGILFLSSTYDNERSGYPIQTGKYYLAWTDVGAKGDNGEMPCEFSINGNSYSLTATKIGVDRDETLSDGSVRRARIYDIQRITAPLTLSGPIDASATTINVSDFGGIGAPTANGQFNLVLELDGETIIATGRASGPNRLTGCVRGVKGTAKSHADGAAGTLSTTQWGGVLTLTLAGTTDKVHYSDLTILGPEDWTPPAEGEPTPLISKGPYDFSAEFLRWSEKGLGILRFMDSTPVGAMFLEPEHMRDPADGTWGLSGQGRIEATFTSVRQFTGGAGKWAYLRHEAPNSQTYSVTLLDPLDAAAAGTKQTIGIQGSETEPILEGTRLINGSEVIRVISGSGTSWLVERGAALTTPAARAAGTIDAGWRLPIAEVVAPPSTGEGGESEGGPGGEAPPQEEGEAVHVELVGDSPHNFNTGLFFDVSGSPGLSNVNIAARRSGTLAAAADATQTTFSVSFDPADWEWIAPGITFLVGSEALVVDSVDSVAGTISIVVPTDKPARPAGASYPLGEPIATRSSRVLCESADGTQRAWQPALDYAYQSAATGPNTLYVNRVPSANKLCTRVVPGQTLDNLTYSKGLPGAAFPYELCVKAAEHANAWLIVNVPGFATDDYIVDQARRILNASTPGKTKFFIELANEIWNWGYPYFEPYGRLAGWGGIGYTADYAVLRSQRVFSLFHSIFDAAGRAGELVHYMPWQPGETRVILSAARRNGVTIGATGCGPYIGPAEPKLEGDSVSPLAAFINAADDAAACDAWVFALARYVGPSSLRLKLERDERARQTHMADPAGNSVMVVHYEGGPQRATTTADTGIVQPRSRNRDMRYDPNWYFAERDFHSLIEKVTVGSAIAVFNNCQHPYSSPLATPDKTEAIWGMSCWWGQKPGRGDGSNGGVNNRLNVFRQGLPNSRTDVDNGNVKDSVRWQATIDRNEDYFANAPPDPEPEDPGGGPTPDPGPPPIVHDPTEQEARIREAIANALRRLPAFDGVYFGAFAGIDGRSAEDRRAVAIEPMDSSRASMWDAGGDGSVIDCRTRITILARDRDGERCDSISGAMLAAAYNALLKTDLGGLVLPEHSALSRWVWQKPKAPERRVEATFSCRYLIDAYMLEDE